MPTFFALENSNKQPLVLMGVLTATLLVAANMIGAGIFGTTGDIAKHIPSPFVIMTCWLAGGLMAFCGALSYGELASRMPRSGGEYHFLSTIFHPALGFLSGFVSLVAGFAASIAFNAAVFSGYISQVFLDNPSEETKKLIGIGLLFLLTLIHAFNVHYGAKVQNAFTLFKISLILTFIIGGLFFVDGEKAQNFTILPQPQDWAMLGSSEYAGALINVFYGYLGWNAAVYITNEIQDPVRNIPRALIYGTLIVTILYLGLNYVFFRTVSVADMTGKVEVGALSANVIFGQKVGAALSTLIALALVSSSSSMIMAGPRVTEMMGSDYNVFRIVTKRIGNGGPIYALGLQFLIAAFLVWQSSYFTILGYIGFMLSIFSFLTVLGVYVVRFKTPKDAPKPSYTTWGYPITPLVYLFFSGWMIYSNLVDHSTKLGKGEITVVYWAIGTIVIGLGLYFIGERTNRKA